MSETHKELKNEEQFSLLNNIDVSRGVGMFQLYQKFLYDQYWYEMSKM